MKKILILGICLGLFTFQSLAQTAGQLSIEECYRLAQQHYPLVKQRDLIAKTADFTVQNIATGFLPQLSFNAQATYQSEVTQLPIMLPGMSALSKDQYKVTGDISQLIYDGGAIKQQKELQKANAQLEQQKLEVSLYQLKDRVNQLFFGILLIDEQVKQNNLLISDIQLGLKKVEALIAGGTALKSNGDVLRADLLKNKQRLVELNSSRKAFVQMLGLLIGQEVSANTQLLKPNTFVPNKTINRPELQTYLWQDKALSIQTKLLNSKTLPKVSLFFQGGYGRPGLNMLNNNFSSYYIGGLRLAWSPSVFYTLKKDRQLLDLNRNAIEIQKETFLFNTDLTVSQQDAEWQKYNELLGSDEEIIKLRTQIKTAAIAQFENGVINSSDYLREANAENSARQNKAIHQIQLLLAQYNLQTTTGNL